MPGDTATALASVVVEVRPNGLLSVRAYIGSKCDSAGHFVPADAGQAITLALKEVRDAVASRVRPL